MKKLLFGLSAIALLLGTHTQAEETVDIHSPRGVHPVSGKSIDAVPASVFAGGDTTVFAENNKAFSRPLANISTLSRREHVVGNSFFNKNWVMAPSSTSSRDGLGPMFNARSCSACHMQDGRGCPPEEGEEALSLIMRLSVAGADPHGAPLPHSIYGGQLSERAIPGASPEGQLRITHEEVIALFGDGESTTLRKPTYEIAGLAYGEIGDVLTSPRVAPAVHGMGLLEAIPQATLLAKADPDDADGDGVSGRANLVYDVESGKKVMGRFGWKANQPDMRQQVAAAFCNDIGITSSVFPNENNTAIQNERFGLDKLPNGGEFELDEKVLSRTTSYLQTIAPPARRDWDKPEVMRGETIFSKIGCAECHTPSHQTDDSSPIKELHGQTIFAYTDLLLHDMGDALADGRPDFEATGSEWRTPPLWGIGLQKVVNGHTCFLHDGRARNLNEAILWHGGEGQASTDAYKELNRDDRAALLAFLNSL